MTNKINKPLLSKLFIDKAFKTIYDVATEYVRVDESFRDEHGNKFPDDFIYPHDRSSQSKHELPQYDTFHNNITAIGVKQLDLPGYSKQMWSLESSAIDNYIADNSSKLLKLGFEEFFEVKYQLCIKMNGSHFPELLGVALFRGLGNDEYSFFTKNEYLHVVAGNEDVFKRIKKRLEDMRDNK